MIATERKPTKRIFGLDLLRVISIALVLCSHTSWIYPPNSSLFSKMIDMCGFFGVELFFVMSGFLIGSIIFNVQGSTFNPKEVNSSEKETAKKL